MPHRGEHPGTQRVDLLHPAEVADDRRWRLGQLLEDGPLELESDGQVEPAGQGQHRTSLVAGLLNAHPSLSASVQARSLRRPHRSSTTTRDGEPASRLTAALFDKAGPARLHLP